MRPHTAAGHGKWANIQHRKGASGCKKGNRNPPDQKSPSLPRWAAAQSDGNPRLRLAVDKTRQQPLEDTIERAISAGASEWMVSTSKEIPLRGYGISSAAIIVGCLTDNHPAHRPIEVRHTRSANTVAIWAPTARWQPSCSKALRHAAVYPGTGRNKLMEAALEAGAEDVVTNDDGSIEVVTIATIS